MLFFLTNRQLIGKILLGLALAASMALKLGGVENYQVFVFPVAILAVSLLLEHKQAKLMLFCAMFWLVDLFWVFPIRFFDLAKNNIVVSQLERDPKGLLLREWLRELKKQNVLSVAINKRFQSNSEIVSWLAKRPSSSYLVTGDANWLNVIFPEHSKFIELVIRETKILSRDDAISQIIFLQKDAEKYALTFVPIELALAREPLELSAGLLAEMSLAVSPLVTENSLELELEQRTQAAMRARRIFGYWKSGIARSWAFYTEATLELLTYLHQTQPTVQLCDTMISKFSTSAKLASSKNSAPNIAAYIYNNAAIANIVCRNDYRKAKSLLNKSLAVSKDSRSKLAAQNNIEAVRNFSN